MTTARSLAKLLLTSSFLLFFACGCLITSNMVNFWPLRYKPSCDVQPVLAIQMPNDIETLAGCPRDKSLAVDGKSKDGEKWPDDIKEFFYFRKGKGEFDCDVEYEFLVFFSEAAAIKRYESQCGVAKRGPVTRIAPLTSGFIPMRNPRPKVATPNI